MIGEGGTSDHNDTVDIVFQSVQKQVDELDDEGKMIHRVVMDDLALWCKTLSVASNKLSQVIYEMMEFLRVGLSARRHMSKERAAVWLEDTLGMIESIKKSLDSKSSESVVDRNSKQGTLIDKINKNSVEKIITMRGNEGKSLWDTIRGKEREQMAE